MICIDGPADQIGSKVVDSESVPGGRRSNNNANGVHKVKGIDSVVATIV
jgi:hypothetical protein